MTNLIFRKSGGFLFNLSIKNKSVKKKDCVLLELFSFKKSRYSFHGVELFPHPYFWDMTKK